MKLHIPISSLVPRPCGRPGYEATQYHDRLRTSLVYSEHVHCPTGVSPRRVSPVPCGPPSCHTPQLHMHTAEECSYHSEDRQRD